MTTAYSEESNHAAATNFSYKYAFHFEENFDPVSSKRWMNQNWQLSVYLGAVYVILVFGGQKLMASRKPVRFRYSFFGWNMILSIFSVIGFLRLAPEFYFATFTMGFHFSVCDNTTFYSNKTAALWYFLFVMSKAPELIDTGFIILRHQKLLFLHWFHHMATLIFTWFLYNEFAAISRWFAILNLLTHAFMYGYFALRTLNYKVPRLVAMIITTVQIVQMTLGTIVSVYAFAMYLRGVPCAVTQYSGLSAVFLYAIYFVLFLRLFYKTYLTATPAIKTKKQ